MSIHSEKHAIVLEVGSRYVKCGLSEERAPRSVLRWEVAELLAKRASAAEYHAYLVPQLHRICFDLLHVNPRHRRFLVCEDVVTPRAFREALVAVVFNELKAASLTLVPSAITALYATSHHTALIVDCGWAETRVLPVYKGIPLQYLYTTASVGASTGCQVIQSALASDDDEKMSLEAAEDVLERACFVQPHKNPIMDIVDARFGGTGDNALVVPAHVRTDACECLFRGTTDSDITVLSCVQEALEKLPIDVRVAMVENLLVLGGTAMLPGFCRRLVDEIRDGLMMEKQGWGDRAALVQPLFPRNMLAWVGASIYASTEAAREHAISSNDFASRGSQCLPDWMSIAEKNI
ncbi:hypothetical protein Poli38472_003369 [Pythium oligandrum]|uniref:Actin-like protein n=1 Tax=Pythium oligandrum TaxID=41045 RepID=A0A8K1C6D9_PYTOL|nr:hypothetical protein Poli38472_003369 [Pythium oligandrum]|eukprot:TMW57444.1 hypothetical protein Poli38472_003369 [Pythium oligandrum]